jgi:hypothetical protein
MSLLSSICVRAWLTMWVEGGGFKPQSPESPATQTILKTTEGGGGGGVPKIPGCEANRKNGFPILLILDALDNRFFLNSQLFID